MSEVDGVPTSTLARTLLDLASVLGSRALEQALAEAERTHLPMEELQELIARYPSRPGIRRLHPLLDGERHLALTRSEAEERFLALTRTAELEPPETNARVAGHEVDFAWRKARIIVEVDGFSFHSSRSSFEADRRRDADLAAQGFLVLRVTWRQLTVRPEAMIVRLAQALAVARQR